MGTMNNTQPRLAATGNGIHLFRRQISASKSAIDIVRYTVELKENRSEASGFELLCIPFLTGKPQTVGVELNEREPALPTHFDDLRQVVPNRGLPPGKLNIAGRRRCLDSVEPELDDIERGIGRRHVAGRRKTIKT